MAPEILMANGYDKMVDYWTIGILLYEMTSGYTPFTANNRNEIF